MATLQKSRDNVRHTTMTALVSLRTTLIPAFHWKRSPSDV
jgi:hypothetical protein